MKLLFSNVSRKKFIVFPAIFIFGFFSTIFALNSCNKEEGEVVEFVNPYKDLGVLHNKILDDALKNSDLKILNQKISNKQIVETILQSSKKVYSSEGLEYDLLNSKGSDSLMRFVEVVNLNLSEYNESAYNLNYYSINVKREIDEFIVLVSETSDIDKIYEILNCFEIKIVNDNNVEEIDKHKIYMFTATYRESIKFWYDNKDILIVQNKGILALLAAGIADAIGATGGPVVSALGSVAFYVSLSVAED